MRAFFPTTSLATVFAFGLIPPRPLLPPAPPPPSQGLGGHGQLVMGTTCPCLTKVIRLFVPI